jgi:hypothetical protein
VVYRHCGFFDLFVSVDYQWLKFDIVVADFDRDIQIHLTMGNVLRNLCATKQFGCFSIQG